MDPAFLVDSDATERVKTLSVWSQFRDDDLLEAEAEGGLWPALPGPGAKLVSERRDR